MRRAIGTFVLLILMSLAATAHRAWAENSSSSQQTTLSSSASQTTQNQVAPAKKTPWYKSRTAKITAGGAAGGALIGGLAGGKKGAAIGALVGGGGGYLYDHQTKKKK